MHNTTDKEWEQKGRDAFNAGEKRKIPYADIRILIQPGQLVGSPESKEANKKMKAWLQGWDMANLEVSIPKNVLTQWRTNL